MADMRPTSPGCHVDNGSSQGRGLNSSPGLDTHRETRRHTYSKGPTCGPGLQFCGNQQEASRRAPRRRWGLKGAVFEQQEESKQFAILGTGQS